MRYSLPRKGKEQVSNIYIYTYIYIYIYIYGIHYELRFFDSI